MEFGLSDETPVLQNLMCNGSEYTLSDCPGYDLNNVMGDYCLSGDYQAGVRCIESTINFSTLIIHFNTIVHCTFFNIFGCVFLLPYLYFYFFFSSYSSHTLL